MDYIYSIIMAIFGGALLIYAGLMALTKDYKMLLLRSRQSVKSKDSKKYMTQLAKVIALTAAVVLVAGHVFKARIREKNKGSRTFGKRFRDMDIRSLKFI